MDFYSFLSMFRINKNCEPENDRNRSKHIVLCDKWNLAVLGRILF